jgi:hypothetical protein
MPDTQNAKEFSCTRDAVHKSFECQKPGEQRHTHAY